MSARTLRALPCALILGLSACAPALKLATDDSPTRR